MENDQVNNVDIEIMRYKNFATSRKSYRPVLVINYTYRRRLRKKLSTRKKALEYGSVVWGRAKRIFASQPCPE